MTKASAPAKPPLAVVLSDKKYLTAEETAEFIGFKQSTLAAYRSRGEGPPYIKPNGGRVLYPRDKLERWLTTNGGKRGARS